jgi:hypothetical protein
MFFLNMFKKSLNDRQRLAAAEKRLIDVRQRKWSDDTEQWIRDNLDHSNWQISNIAIKLIGLRKLSGFFEILSCFLLDSSRTPFIRRNSARTLYAFDAVDDAVLKAFVRGLDDTYWEVRTESANGLMIHASPDKSLTQLLITKIYRKPLSAIPVYPIFRPGRIFREKNFEVRAAMFGALGTVLSDEDYIHALEIPLEEDIWKVREAALKAFVKASYRLGFSDSEIQEKLNRLDLTCTEFIPTFPIRKTYSHLSDRHCNGLDNETNSQVVNHAS